MSRLTLNRLTRLLRHLWRNVAHGEAIEAVLRDRALTTFGKQRV